MLFRSLFYIMDRPIDKTAIAESISFQLADGLAAFETKNFALAMQHLTPLADQGNPEAMFRVAIINQNGLGWSQDTDKAYRYMQSAAEKGHAFAQHSLAFMYHQGECTDVDSDLAVKWYSMAAKQGLSGSMVTLGMMYDSGDGVEEDKEMAQTWYRRAEEQQKLDDARIDGEPE